VGLGSRAAFSANNYWTVEIKSSALLLLAENPSQQQLEISRANVDLGWVPTIELEGA